MSPAIVSAIFRFAAILIALGVAAAIVVFVPDPALKTVGAGLAAAAVLALEEYLKNVPSSPAIASTVVLTTRPPVVAPSPAPITPPPPIVPPAPIVPPTPVAPPAAAVVIPAAPAPPAKP